jgi:UDP-glucose 4-epimerase
MVKVNMFVNMFSRIQQLLILFV